MSTNETKIIESLWDEYRDKNIKPETSPNDLKALSTVFLWGAYMMFREMVEMSKDCWQVLNNEFAELDKEIHEDNHRNDPSRVPEV